MNRKVSLISLFVSLTLLLYVTGALAQEAGPQNLQDALGTAFTYQGQLRTASGPVTGVCDLAFRLYDDASVGSQVGNAITSTVPITNGYFTVQLDFGASVFAGDARWLEIAVQCPAGSGSFATLAPRQPLTPAPYALALPGLYTQQNATSPNVIGGYSGNVISPTVVGGVIGGGGASGVPNRVWANYAAVGGGKGNIASGFATTIGGGESNIASSVDATVGGGWHNTANNNNTTVSGGTTNTASGSNATVGGGGSNTASGASATIGGGESNTANFDYTTIGGGEHIIATGRAATVAGGSWITATGAYAAVGGGEGNTASGEGATVPGGVSNSATMFSSFAAGRRAKANHDGAFVWGDSTDADFASTANDQFLIRANGGVGINTNQPRTTLEIVKSNESSLGGTLRLSNPAGGTDAQVALDFATYDVGSNAPAARILANDVGNYSADILFQTKAPGAMDNALQTNMKVRTNGYIAIEYLSTGGSTILCRNASNDIATCSSSLRYKNNVADLTLGLDAIARLRPVTFDWKDSGQADLGFVAEEVHQLTPLLTTLNAQGQIEGVKYDRITAVLVKGMQEQQAQIVSLQQQNETLQSQNAEQRSQIHELQTQVAQAQPGTSPASFNAFNVISVVALLGMIVLWRQQRRSQQRGGTR